MGPAENSLRFFLEKLSYEELASAQDLISELLRQKEPELHMQVPVQIFSQGLNAVEALTKFLKENRDMRFVDIAELLDKKENTVWLNYQRASEKMPGPLRTPPNPGLSIPVKNLVHEKLSLVECLVRYLRDEKRLSNKETAKLLGTSDVVTSTAYSRMKRKLS